MSRSASDPQERLNAYRAAGILSDLDCHLALALSRRGGDPSQEVALAAAFASRAVRGGHVCCTLDQLDLSAMQDPTDPKQVEPLPQADVWKRHLEASSLVAKEPEAPSTRPLFLDGAGRVYLSRYAQYQQRLAEELNGRLEPTPVDTPVVRSALDRLFPPVPGETEVNRQRLAAITAVAGLTTFVTGGPGTGKTYTVARILALLVETSLIQRATPPVVELVAPTGKAAQRLAQSLGDALADPSFEAPGQVREAIPQTAGTVHRLLGYQPRTPTLFRHHRDNPILADIVLVDEASMVDLALMCKLVEAIPRRSRVIFLGDKDQLASVEAGAVLGDICSGFRGAYSATFCELVRSLTGEHLLGESELSSSGLQDRIVELQHSRRYSEGSGIGRLARALRAGQGEAALATLEDADDLELHAMGDVGAEWLPGRLQGMLGDAFRGYLGLSPAEKLRALGKFRILCAHRSGPRGVDALNREALRLLRAENLLLGEGEFYVGRPILVTENDYTQGLYNGDVGVVDLGPGGALRVFFPGTSGSLTALSPGRLPPHESVFAMTVHKSQGSEFDAIALVLPGQDSKALTRELVYTAITRARRAAAIFGDAELLAAAASRSVERMSGLGDLLWRRP